VALLGAGRTNHEISERLTIGAETVKTHIALGTSAGGVRARSPTHSELIPRPGDDATRPGVEPWPVAPTSRHGH